MEDATRRTQAVHVDFDPTVAPQQISRTWNALQEIEIGGASAFNDLIPTTILPITDPRKQVVTPEEIPAIPTLPEHREIPYIKYYSDDNPTLLIHGVCIAMMQRYQCFPSAVFIAPGRIPLLQLETEDMTGHYYDGYFRLYHARGPAQIAIYTEYMLPLQIKGTLANGHLPLKCVIALKEFEPPYSVKPL